MSRKRIFYIVFFSVLVVGFFIIMSFLVPGFTDPPLKPIGRTKSFHFTNQDGRTITEKDIANKVVAIEYFFTTCKGICPRMNNNLRKVHDAHKKSTDFLILSHTCDPETDSVPRLKQYADSMQVDTRQWMFLTGRKDSLYYMARHAYKIDDPGNNLNRIEDDFLHTQFIALINKRGEVVKIYDGLKTSEIAAMEKEVGRLLKN